mgnify:CR=1 FL=1
MSKKVLTVALPGREYDIEIERGLLSRAGERCRALLPKAARLYVITDSNVAPLYGDRVADSLTGAGFQVKTKVVPAGEASKNAHQLIELWEDMMAFGLTRTDAVAALGGTAYAAHYVRSGIGRILFSDELAAFARNISLLRTPAQAFLFFGDSYGELLAELEHSEEKDEGRLISYGEAYRRLRLPAHLLTCDDAGVTQLRIMSTPNYRAKLTRIALKSKYTPPPEDLPQCDALFDGAPFLLAADMDLRRIDAAAHAARERRCGPIVLAALEAQAEAVLYGRYRDTGKARVFTLTDAALKEFLGAEAAGRDPSQLLFTTAKGEVIHAPLIKAH